MMWSTRLKFDVGWRWSETTFDKGSRAEDKRQPSRLSTKDLRSSRSSLLQFALARIRLQTRIICQRATKETYKGRGQSEQHLEREEALGLQ